jgi:hypothetical protein
VSADAVLAAPRHGDWMQTFTGRAFYPLDPRGEDIDVLDIAHGLSLLCRYGGQCARFYSVAEHCVLMSRAVAPENALWALLHDATEAYMGDLIRPLKRALPDYAQAELNLMLVIASRFGLRWDYNRPGGEPAEVKAADTRILVDERAALMTLAPQPWTALENVEPLGVIIRCWSPVRAEIEYLDRLAELTDVHR